MRNATASLPGFVSANSRPLGPTRFEFVVISSPPFSFYQGVNITPDDDIVKNMIVASHKPLAKSPSIPDTTSGVGVASAEEMETDPTHSATLASQERYIDAIG